MNKSQFDQFISQENSVRKLGKYPQKYADYLDFLKSETSFLTETAPVSQRKWHYVRNSHTLPKCKVCDNSVNFDTRKSDYRQYCSNKCIGLDVDVIDKRNNTSLANWGVDNPSKCDIIKDKIKLTLKQNYPEFAHPLQSPEARAKYAATSLLKYGTEHPMQNPNVKQKLKDSFRSTFGVDHPLHLQQFKDKQRQTNNARYGVDYQSQHSDYVSKARSTSLKNYGTLHPHQSPVIQDRLRNTSLQKYGVPHFTQQHFSQSTTSTLNNPSALIKLHHDDQLSLTQIAEILSVSDVTVGNYLTMHGIPIIRHPSSSAEVEIAKLLSQKFVIIRNDRKLIAPYELDIVIPEKKLAVEYCGLYWHSEIKKSASYHHKKLLECQKIGYRLITIFEHEWLENRPLVENKILNILGYYSNVKKIYARKCEIVKISQESKKKFFSDNHIQGDGPSSINYGLRYNDKIVAVMGLIEKKDHFVLNRYATSCNVPGGFTRLLSVFDKLYNRPTIVTFADLRWSNGELYTNSGFILDKTLPPDYYWVKSGKVYHKFNFRHATGLKKLPNYDPNLSEAQNMRKHGYYKLWDCGKLRFIRK